MENKKKNHTWTKDAQQKNVQPSKTTLEKKKDETGRLSFWSVFINKIPRNFQSWAWDLIALYEVNKIT